MGRLARALSLMLTTSVLGWFSLNAQVATLVADINSREGGYSASSDPRRLVLLSSKVVFTASDATSGRELWATDGTAAGTELLADACPGPCSADPDLLGTTGAVSFWRMSLIGAQSLWRSDGSRRGTFSLLPPEVEIDLQFPLVWPVTLSGRLFFSGCTVPRGCELWTSDGSISGTHRVFDEDDPDSPLHPQSFTAVGNRLFFANRGSEPGLWVSNGTAQGTSLVRRFAAPPFPRALVNAGGRLYFIAHGAGSQEELWISDGTPAGTRQLSRFNSPAALAGTAWLKPVGTWVYFIADVPTHGQEIWRADGTPAGTRRVTEFSFQAPLHFESYVNTPREWEGLHGDLLFVATDGITPPRLWKTSGTPASTVPLMQGCLADCPSIYPVPPALVRRGEKVYFSARDDNHGTELWSTDGTPAGTGLIRDLCQGQCSGLSGAPEVVGEYVQFVGATSDNDLIPRQLWRTEGTAAGTRVFSDLPVGVQLDRYGIETAAIGGAVVFPAAGPHGVEIWTSDGRPGGTRMVRDLAEVPPASRPSDLHALGERLLFRAGNERIYGVWQSSGTTDTTFPVSGAAVYPCSFASNATRLVSTRGLLFFWACDQSSSRLQLWRTDGTPEGTLQLSHFAGQVDSETKYLVVLGDEVFFDLDDEIWRSDGTVAGTTRALDLPEALEVTHLSVAGAALYFVTRNPQGGQQLWWSDGTDIQELRTGLTFSFIPPSFTAVESLVYFVAQDVDDPYLRDELWVTDGTVAGTRRVKVFGNIEPPIPLLALNGSLFFFAPAPYGTAALWVSRGTESDTFVLRQFDATVEGVQTVPLAMVVGTRIYFRASDGKTGRELWSSDGTVEGTRLVADIAPGPASSDPGRFTTVGGKLFFAAHDSIHGFELWRSDGTASGTQLVHDIAPGAESSYPTELTAVGNRIFFSANDGVTGHELWMLDLTQPAGVCQPSGTTLCLGGRFRIETLWKDFDGNSGVGQAVPLTAETGAFWFFGPENIEVILKVLDGRGLNQHHWVFYGALSSVEYALTVTDVQTGLTARYWNPSGQLASVADTTGFGPLGAFSVVERSTSGPPPRIGAEAAATGPCQPAATRLCLRGGRFAVEATWKDFSGNTGVGSAVPLTGDTGYFWFFGADNVEVVLKVLDGTPVNGKHWVFYGALSSVEYTLRVTDTATGAVKTYTNKSGNLASVADTGAF